MTHLPETYRPDIDGLRAIAVLSVIGFHAFPDWAPGGFVGVDIFFVISGFLISGIILKSLQQNSFSIADFYSRRIKRIFPALITVLMTCLVFGWFVLFVDEYNQLGKHVAAGSAFISNLVLWHEAGYFDVAASSKPLLHLWSLGIEEQFYLAWPVLLLAAHRIDRRLVPWAIAAIAFSSFVLGVKTVNSDSIEAFYSPATRLWELLAGGVLAYQSGRSIFDGERARNVKSIAGLACIAVSIFTFNKQMAFPGWWALLPVTGACLCISAGPKPWLNRKVLSLPILLWIGLISFPLYLWHWPLLSFARIIESTTPPAEVRIAAIAASFILAWLTYLFIETPIRTRKTVMTSGRLAIMAAFTGAIGLYAYNAIDFPFRPIQTKLNFDIAKMGAERYASMQTPHCHFYKQGQSFAEYKLTISDCLALSPTRKNILVMGDSHALDLRMSLAAGYPNINFLEATGAGCAPIEQIQKADGTQCAALIHYIKHDFPELKKVDGVILTAKWDTRFRYVVDDVRYFQSLGLPVVIFGPTFEFTDDAPKILARNMPHRQPNTLMALFSVQSKFDLDLEMESFFKSKNIGYISKIKTLCSERICPVVSEKNDLYILDYGHWSKPGAYNFGDIFFSKHSLERTLFGGTERRSR